MYLTGALICLLAIRWFYLFIRKSCCLHFCSMNAFVRYIILYISNQLSGFERTKVLIILEQEKLYIHAFTKPYINCIHINIFMQMSLYLKSICPQLKIIIRNEKNIHMRMRWWCYFRPSWLSPTGNLLW